VSERTVRSYLTADGPAPSIAHLAYLGSAQARYVDGARFVVDGGWVAQGWQTG
jgi:hypothetical protein